MDQPATKTILITGGAGFVGTNAASYFLERGYKVVAFDNLIRPGVETNVLKHDNYTFFRGDARHTPDLDEVATQHSIDAIIHLSANPGIPWSIRDPMYDFHQNATASLNILELARKLGNIPVIYNSTNKVYSDEVNTLEMTEWRTRYVYGKTEWTLDHDNKDKLGRPSARKRQVSPYLYGIDEKFPTDGLGEYPHSPYGVSKLAGDLYMQEYWHVYGVPTVSNRCSCLYGKYQHGVADQGWVAWFMIAKIMGKPLTIFGDGKQVRDALYGKDLAKLYHMELLCLWDKEARTKIAGKVFNIGGGYRNTISLLEAVELIEQLDKGQHAKLTYDFADWRTADHKIFYCDIKKIKDVLGWEPETTVSHGFSQTFEWFKENQNIWQKTHE